MEGEFNLAMGGRGVSSSTLNRMFLGKIERKANTLTEQFILNAISKLRERAKAVKRGNRYPYGGGTDATPRRNNARQGMLPDELPSKISDNVPEKKRPSFINSLREKIFKS